MRVFAERVSNSDDDDESDQEDKYGFPRFPLVPDAVIGHTHMNERKARLEKWLKGVLAVPINRDHHETVGAF